MPTKEINGTFLAYGSAQEKENTPMEALVVAKNVFVRNGEIHQRNRFLSLDPNMANPATRGIFHYSHNYTNVTDTPTETKPVSRQRLKLVGWSAGNITIALDGNDSGATTFDHAATPAIADLKASFEAITGVTTVTVHVIYYDAAAEDYTWDIEFTTEATSTSPLPIFTISGETVTSKTITHITSEGITAEDNSNRETVFWKNESDVWKMYPNILGGEQSIDTVSNHSGLSLIGSSKSVAGTFNQAKFRRFEKTIYIADGSNPGFKFAVDLRDQHSSYQFFPNGLPAGTGSTGALLGGTRDTGGAAATEYGGKNPWWYAVWAVKNNTQTLIGNIPTALGRGSQTLGGLTAGASEANWEFAQRPAGYEHITHIRLYASLDSAAGPYGFVKDIAFADMTFDTASERHDYVDDLSTAPDFGEPLPETLNVLDATLPGANQHAQINFAYEHLEVYGERMWYASTDNELLYFSEPPTEARALPESVPSFNFLVIGSTQDPFVELIARSQFLLIVKKYSMWIVEGTSKAEFRVQQITEYGSFCPHMTFWHKGWLYYADDSGIYRSQLFSEPERLSDKILEDWDGFSKLNIEKWSYAIDPHSGFIWFILDVASGINTKVFVFDPTGGHWVGTIEASISQAFNIKAAEKGAGDSGRNYLFFGESNAGDIEARIYDNSFTLITDTGPTVKWQSVSTCDIDIELGQLLHPHMPIGKKLFRRLKLFHRGLAAENIKLHARIDGSDVTIDDTVATVDGGMIERNVGRSGDHMAPIIQSTGIAAAAAFKITRLLLEWEEIGR